MARIDAIIFVTVFIVFCILLAAGLSVIKDEELKQEYFAATCEAKNGVWIKKCCWFRKK